MRVALPLKSSLDRQVQACPHPMRITVRREAFGISRWHGTTTNVANRHMRTIDLSRPDVVLNVFAQAADRIVSGSFHGPLMRCQPFPLPIGLLEGLASPWEGTWPFH